MKTYEGRREGHVVCVTVNGRPLNPQLHLYNHSPSGFEWGYGGSGPAQLALAIMVDHVGDTAEALHLYQRFKWAVVSDLPFKAWTLTTEDIDKVVEKIRFDEPLSLKGAI
jgi:hypothetical protein